MQIRPYTPYDAETTRRIFHAAVSTTAAHDYTPEQISSWLDGAQDQSAWHTRLASALSCLVLEDTQGPYAFASLKEDGEIDLLMCHPRCARQGAATHLLKRLEHIAQEYGLKQLFTQASLSSRPVFEKRRFQLSENRTVHGMACFGMFKTLD